MIENATQESVHSISNTSITLKTSFDPLTALGEYILQVICKTLVYLSGGYTIYLQKTSNYTLSSI